MNKHLPKAPKAPIVLKCEVCKVAGSTPAEQAQIDSIGLCYCCTPRRGKAWTENVGVTSRERFPDAVKRVTLRPDDFYKG